MSEHRLVARLSGLSHELVIRLAAELAENNPKVAAAVDAFLAHNAAVPPLVSCTITMPDIAMQLAAQFEAEAKALSRQRNRHLIMPSSYLAMRAVCSAWRNAIEAMPLSFGALVCNFGLWVLPDLRKQLRKYDQRRLAKVPGSFEVPGSFADERILSGDQEDDPVARASVVRSVRGVDGTWQQLTYEEELVEFPRLRDPIGNLGKLDEALRVQRRRDRLSAWLVRGTTRWRSIEDARTSPPADRIVRRYLRGGGARRGAGKGGLWPLCRALELLHRFDLIVKWLTPESAIMPEIVRIMRLTFGDTRIAEGLFPVEKEAVLMIQFHMTNGTPWELRTATDQHLCPRPP